MAGTKTGVLKVAAIKAGLTLEGYVAALAEGLKWCWRCRRMERREDFNIDRRRYDGLASSCRASCLRENQRRYAKKRKDDRRPHGPAWLPERDGDKAQARHRVNLLVRTGRLPKPSTVPCVDCGHAQHPGCKNRHEYDHVGGYKAGAHRHVEAVCQSCHWIREAARTSRGCP